MQIKEMKADGKNTVIFDLESGSADFPYVLSDYNLNITPPDIADIVKGIGTGGYKLVDYEPGVRAFTKRNPNYWKEGRAHFDEIETIHIADATARNNALMTGKVDLIDKCDMKTYDRLLEKAGIQGIEPIGLRHYNFAMLTDRPPFDNNDARLAMKYAIDREQILKQVYRNHGTVGNDHPISSIMRFFNSELPQRVYDPEKAKYHLKKAGLQGHTFKLHLSEVTFPGALDAGSIFKESAAKADIRIDLVREPSDGFWSNVWQKVPFSGASWLGRPTEDMMFALVYADGASWNDTHWKHERFNKLLKEARAELDEEKRRSMYWEMQKIVRDEGGEIVSVFITEPDAASDKLKFENLAGNMALDGMKCFERWWFAA
jgi:peptide/nickel transport system substrate-binding protein